MSSALPESLRRILAAQKPSGFSPASTACTSKRTTPAAMPDSLRRVLGKSAPTKPDTISTLIWKDGEAWRETAPGRWKYLGNISA